MPRWSSLSFALFLAATSLSCYAVAADQYGVIFCDGTHTTGKSLSKTTDSSGRIALDRKPLLKGSRPARLLYKIDYTASEPEAFVELTNGDRLPGEVVKYVDANSRTRTPAHFVVAPYHCPTRVRRRKSKKATYYDQVSVRAECVRRIVYATPAAARIQPGRIVRKSAPDVYAKSLRPLAEGFAALTDSGVEQVAANDLLEVHLPNRHRMQDLLSEARRALRIEDPYILRIETEDSAVLTFPHRMMTTQLPRTWVEKSKGSWVAIQPAWALSTVLVDMDQVSWWLWREPNELPLSCLPTQKESSKQALHHLPWRRDRSVVDRSLAVESIVANLGLGTHSHSEIDFQLPPRAVEFRSLVGIDNAAQGGGCARVRVRVIDANDKARDAFASNVLRGGHAAQSINVGGLSGARSLRLVTEMEHEGRSTGDDPLDIRDYVDWLFPFVRVKLDLEKGGIADLALWIPELRGWDLKGMQWADVRFRPVWRNKENVWMMGIVPKTGSETVFQRRIHVSPAAAFLPIAVARSDEGGGSLDVSVKIDDVEAGSTMNGNIRVASQDRQIQTRTWVLSKFAKRHVNLSIVAQHKGRKKEAPPAIVVDAATLLPLVDGLPETGRPLKPDVWLTDVKPIVKHLTDRGRIIPGHTTDGSALEVRGYPFENGFAVSTGSKLTYAIDPAWRRFVAVLGLASGWKGVGPYQVLADDEPIWTSQKPAVFARNEQAYQLNVAIPPNTKRLTLKVDGTECYGAWAEAGFLK